MPAHFSFQSYAWSLGTTSFRMANFHRKVEEQLIILHDFWKSSNNANLTWDVNTQKSYYDFAYGRGFITGDLAGDDASKAKTARQKTSGLVDIGLIDDNRHLTSVGNSLLQLTLKKRFACDNDFRIPADSFIYLKQILKTTCTIQDGLVRPFLVAGKVLKSCDGYLTDDEFAYLLPLCVDESTMNDIIAKIAIYRVGKTTIDDIICDTVLNRYNYPAAQDYFVHSDKTDTDIMVAGMNRKSPQYDVEYVDLYGALLRVYLHNDDNSVRSLLNACKKIKNNKIRTLWRALLFENIRSVHNLSDVKTNEFSTAVDEEAFARIFFKYLHLHKIKANLSDYRDLNRRHLNITDAFLFDDGKVTFAPIFDYFFNTEACLVFNEAFESCSKLSEDCDLLQISPYLVFDAKQIIESFNAKQKQHVNTIEEIYEFVETERYSRFRKLIDTKFPNDKLIDVLLSCETRDKDDEIIDMFGGEADVPTIFEYVVGIAWYRLSGYEGKILEYMKLSLESNLLPRTHAGGGESDIVYKYPATKEYPEHTLLIECTLMEGTTQRHGEMEPVSRHLSNYMIDECPNTYCAFVANNLHPTLVSDFRGRKAMPYYRSDTDHVDGMKIIPLHTNELRTLLSKNVTYSKIYAVFEAAYSDTVVVAPPQWYRTCVKAEIEVL